MEHTLSIPQGSSNRQNINMWWPFQDAGAMFCVGRKPAKMFTPTTIVCPSLGHRIPKLFKASFMVLLLFKITFKDCINYRHLPVLSMPKGSFQTL